MKKRNFQFACALVIAVIAYPGTSNANVASPVKGTHISISHRVEYAPDVEICYSFFNFQQLVTISGKNLWVWVENRYMQGHYDLFLLDSCNGYYILGVGNCACITFPENTPEETESVGTKLNSAISVGRTIERANHLLWIRKEKKLSTLKEKAIL